MDHTTIVVHKKIKMKKPVLIEGLPGIGLVGKIAADHLIKERKAVRVATVYSPHFPHQVIMRKNGVIRMLRMKFYHAKGPKHDLLILVGDVQPISSEAQYEVNGKLLDYFHSQGGNWIITLGGYGTGKKIDNARVLGAATHKKLVPIYEKFGIVFGQSRGAIVGAAGLLLGLGRMRGMHGLCLMGETHGAYVDPKSAVSLLQTLGKMTGVKIDVAELEKKVKEGEKYIKKMEADAAKAQGGELPPASGSSGELSYIR